MGIGEPVVEGKQGHLDAKADQQGAEQQQLAAHGQPFTGDRREAEVRGARQQGQPQKSPQDQHAGYGGEDQKLGGRIGPVDAAPDGDQAPEGDQFELVEKEKEQQVFGQKGTVDGATNYQQQQKIDARPLVDVAGADGRNQRQSSVDQHQGQGQAIHAELVFEPQAFHPGQGFLQLHGAVGGVEAGQHHQAPGQLQAQHHQGHRAHAPLRRPPGPEGQQQGSGKGNQ